MENKKNIKLYQHIFTIFHGTVKNRKNAEMGSSPSVRITNIKLYQRIFTDHLEIVLKS